MKKIIEVKIKEKEIIKEILERFRKAGKNKADDKEIEDQFLAILKEKISEAIEKAEKGSQLRITVLRGFFVDEEIRKENIENFFKFFESEKKKWIKETCGLNKEMLQGKSFREKEMLFLISIPFDWYTINTYFNLLKNFAKGIIECCNLDLPKEKFNILLDKLKKDTEELKFLDKVFSDYCNLDSFYYQKIKEIFERRFFSYSNNPESNEIVKKIREII